MEDRVIVTMVAGQYRGFDLRKPRSEAENLVMTGQARWKVETRPAPKVETPEAPSLESMTRKQLEDLAAARGVEVERADGEGLPVKADYLRALGG